MVSVIDVVGLLFVLGVNAAAAALLTRFFRVRLDTQWGPIVFTLLITPVVLVLATLFLSGVLGLGFNLGSTNAVVAVAVVLPLALGAAFDYFWMPAPDEVELPAEYAREDSPRR
ncbi:hypothetical protein ACFQPA_21935 [Halomarina halobia]|uniref:DUF7991 domain-containing protein n=1 Tax=Halomarina halobia TaxID=3033386 RepID=A0ABD6A7T4_9EURY|nr:hypothetical protein [Halomarina sp. PSR21]